MTKEDKHRKAYAAAYAKGKANDIMRNIVFEYEVSEQMKRRSAPVAPHSCRRERTERWSPRFRQTMVVEWRH